MILKELRRDTLISKFLQLIINSLSTNEIQKPRQIIQSMIDAQNVSLSGDQMPSSGICGYLP